MRNNIFSNSHPITPRTPRTSRTPRMQLLRPVSAGPHSAKLVRPLGRTSGQMLDNFSYMINGENIAGQKIAEELIRAREQSKIVKRVINYKNKSADTTDITDNTLLQTKEIYAIINNNNAGGSFKWQTDIAKHIPIYQITNYNSLLLFLKTNSNKEITITINSFLATDFTVRHILDLYSQYKFDIILPFHDWYWFDLSHVYNNNIHNVYLNKKLVITDEVAQLFRISKILCATYFIKDILERVIDTSNITVVPWIDYKIENYTNTKLVNIEESKTIVIGVLTETSEYKGQEQVDYLAKRFKYFKNKYNVKLYVLELIYGNIMIILKIL